MTIEKDEAQVRKALVTVFEDIETAKTALHKLVEAGFKQPNVELVLRDVDHEAPEVKTPRVHETTTTALVDQVAQGGTFGAVMGTLAAFGSPFPGLVLGTALMGGVTGAIVGGMAGLDHAVEDESVNLPSIDDYQHLVDAGHPLVVVLGTHDEVMRAEATIDTMPSIHRHLHIVQGHEHHEHPTRSPQ